MPRKPRVHYSNAFYHVMIRGNARAQIFFNDHDRNYFLFLLQKGIEKYQHCIHAFCLMANHVHLLIQVKEIPLYRIMHNINFRYARYMNNKFDRVGHVFQGRYKAILVENDTYLKHVLRYIHLNPSPIVKCINDYKWSSHRDYLGDMKFCWITTDFLLNMFSEDVHIAHSAYQKFFYDNATVVMPKDLHEEYYNLTREVFLCELYARNLGKLPCNFNLENLAILVCDYYGVSLKQLRDHDKAVGSRVVCTLIVMIAIEYELANVSEIAGYLNRHVSTLSEWIKKVSVNKEDSLFRDLRCLKRKFENEVWFDPKEGGDLV